MQHYFENGSDTLVIELKTGETLRVCEQDVFGVEGYQVKVLASKTLILKPETSNSVTLTTAKAQTALEEEIQRVIAERDKHKKGARC